MLSRSFTSKELQLNQIIHNQIASQIRLASLVHDSQIKPLRF